MDSSADTRTDFHTYLPEMLLETVLTLINIESFFSSIVSGRFSCKKRLFFRLKQNKLTFGLLSQFTPKMDQVLFDSGSCLANTQVTSLLKTYVENRELLIVSLFGKFVLVTKSEILELLGIKVKQKLEEGTLIKRRIDCDIFIAMLIDNTVNEVETDNLSKNKPLADDILKVKDILSAVNITNVTLKLTSRDITKTAQRRNEICHYDMSLEPYLGRGSSSSAGSELSGSERVNIYSAPDISYERQTAVDRNIVASGTGIPLQTKPPRYKDYFEQQKRQASFYTPKWSRDNKPDSSILAECGFFFTGNADLVRCHQCGIGFKDWARDDDVLTEHVRYSKSCEFLVQKFGNSKIDRIKLALTSGDKNETASVDSPLPYKIRSPRYQTMEARLTSFKDFPKQNNLTAQQLAVAGLYFTGDKNETASVDSPLPYKIRSPRYQTMEARLTSFKDFPKQNNLTAQQLAVAGLYFTGKGDLCRCFTCDGGLKDWSSGDDPIKEHATHFPNCSYINQLKGSEYIKSQQQNLQRNEPMKGTGGSSTISQPTQSSPNLPSDRLTIADSEYRDRKDYRTILQKNTKKFVEDLCPLALLDEFSRSEFLTFVEIRDIQELPLTSEKTREILRKVMMRGERGYKTFKECLQKCNQGHLVEILEREAVHDEDSSFHASQVVQELGYAEIDVRTAKAELERKGKRFPTAEDIVNTLLDKQECAEQYQTRASSKENGNDLQAVVEENKKLSSLIYCMVCITGEADILFLPCTHLRICHECAEDHIFCPICNASIKEKVKISRS